MNKQEIQTMIDSTIVPNKKKGITAESLRLVLKEMATATPEATSSSDFVKRIWIDETLGIEPTEEHIAENRATSEFFKNGGYALVTLCYNLEGLERFSLLCDTAQFFDDMFVSASASWDDNYYTIVSNTIGVSVQLYADGSIWCDFKRSGYLAAYLPKDGEELSDVYKDYNKEIYDIITSGDVPSPIMIKAEHATYTSSIVAFENEEARIVFVAGFDTNTGVAYMGKMSIQSDGTTAIL